ncbi:MAG: lysylphosphatidylglycerol synthase transmembrane domain-containing protein [Sedimenticola sp.]
MSGAMLKKSLKAIAPPLIAILLLYLVFEKTGIYLSTILSTIQSTPTWLFILLLATTLLQIFISALKWRLVTQKVSTSHSIKINNGFYVFYTALGASLGQLIPVHISSIITRSLALRAHGNLNIKKGAFTSLYEQAFDLLIPIILVPSSLIAYIFDYSVTGWLLLSLASIFLGGWIVSEAGEKLSRSVCRYMDRKKLKSAFHERIHDILQACIESGLFENKFLRRIFYLSTFRFISILFRAILIAMLIGSAITALDVAKAFPLVQTTLLIAITPGGLGISEWSWIGIFNAIGVNLDEAGLFAIVHRIYIVLTVFLICIVSGIYFYSLRSNQKQ